ncbi:type II toxin-antitoxin system death-on-curing family toxin [Salicibibacter cibarius]|uniref:Type II toxin-antitoxin system death-on-curing family toxin n=1 Tax=Salicibibacter cibarius TaxID=2743000 RepID=A0A7T6Z0G0_9BACI|nr:type II toxin-antitoxin system death-on-curing family toxin [Salicibibacter cibarius]QQK74604.1 type II toxin-antitoxin system death-on-curing family toxin [Salicibibacter cibarius]
MRFLTVKEVEAINQYIILKYSPGEPIGVKSLDLLESAVYRPQQSAFGEDAYPTVYEKTAALFESLAQNHPFYNANKRTAFISLTQFLYYNGYDFEMTSQKEQENFTVDVVT